MSKTPQQLAGEMLHELVGNGRPVERAPLDPASQQVYDFLVGKPAEPEPNTAAADLAAVKSQPVSAERWANPTAAELYASASAAFAGGRHGVARDLTARAAAAFQAEQAQRADQPTRSVPSDGMQSAVDLAVERALAKREAK